MDISIFLSFILIADALWLMVAAVNNFLPNSDADFRSIVILLIILKQRQLGKMEKTKHYFNMQLNFSQVEDFLNDAS